MRYLSMSSTYPKPSIYDEVARLEAFEPTALETVKTAVESTFTGLGSAYLDYQRYSIAATDEEDTTPVMSQEEWHQSEYYRKGAAYFNGMTVSDAKKIADIRDNLERLSAVSEKQSTSQMVGSFLTSLGVGIVEPKNVALGAATSTALGVAGGLIGGPVGASLGLGLGGIISSIPRRIARGAVEGGLSTAAAEPQNLNTAEFFGVDYDIEDSFINIAQGVVFGGAIGGIGGLLSQRKSKVSPPEIQEELRTFSSTTEPEIPLSNTASSRQEWIDDNPVVSVNEFDTVANQLISDEVPNPSAHRSLTFVNTYGTPDEVLARLDPEDILTYAYRASQLSPENSTELKYLSSYISESLQYWKDFLPSSLRKSENKNIKFIESLTDNDITTIQQMIAERGSVANNILFSQETALGRLFNAVKLEEQAPPKTATKKRGRKPKAAPVEYKKISLQEGLHKALGGPLSGLYDTEHPAVMRPEIATMLRKLLPKEAFKGSKGLLNKHDVIGNQRGLGQIKANVSTDQPPPPTSSLEIERFNDVLNEEGILTREALQKEFERMDQQGLLSDEQKTEIEAINTFLEQNDSVWNAVGFCALSALEEI